MLFNVVRCEPTRSILEKEQRRNSLIKTLVLRRKVLAASANPTDSCELGSLKYFLFCGLGGALACGFTHLLVTPLDIVKCRIQVDPGKYKNLVHGFRVTFKEEGAKGFTRGWAPTLMGYAAQGSFKFGLYEVFKVLCHHVIGDENAYLYRTAMYLISSASAEFFGDIALSPMEAIKVKIQTTPGYARTLREAAPKMYKEEGFMAFYKSLGPLWMRQIPYTTVKFVSFERTLELLYFYVVPKPREKCSKFEQLIVTFCAGYIAGILCAIVSHPADTLVSKLNQRKGSTAGGLLKELGFMGLWGGIVPRIIMIGTLTALQWFIYDGFKVFMRMPRPPPPEMPASLRKKLGK
ncbi:unnamed protein product [Phyllotreta striolata]|uniref:Phosphate carrier protein, mitochondrial n=1 Tax=Phyllotreta striolata TaxID=444603 RepID=A0A9N9TRT7_PHYSR|nr:unnamed protein product [Phyllotreta striolata]